MPVPRASEEILAGKVVGKVAGKVGAGRSSYDYRTDAISLTSPPPLATAFSQRRLTTRMALRPGPCPVSRVLSTSSTPRPPSSLPAARRAVLSALLLRAPGDSLAAEVFMAALVTALHRSRRTLPAGRWWNPGRSTLFVTIGGVGGDLFPGRHSRAWPDRAVVCRGTRLRPGPPAGRGSAGDARETVSYELADGASTWPDAELDELFAADMLAATVTRGTIDLRAARLVWALRVQGLGCAEVAELLSCSPEAVSMERLRAVRALRAVLTRAEVA